MPLQRTPTTSANEYVTLRRHRTLTNDSLDLSFGSTTSEIERHSPLDLDLQLDLSTRYRCDIEELKKEILQLKNELVNAYEEINKLKENMLQTNNNDSKILHSETNRQEKQVSRKKPKKKKSRHNNIRTSSPLSAIGNSSCFEASTTDDDTVIESNKSAIEIANERNPPDTQNKLKTTPSMETMCNQQLLNLINNKHKHTLQHLCSSVTGGTAISTQCNLNNRITSNKICIISDNNVNNILKTAEYTFTNSKIIHYCLTNAGITELFVNLELKLVNYTLQDYCIIFLGTKDFEMSFNYEKLVEYIKNKLEKITHTNVIICSPNFKLGANVYLFNKKIEAFNYHLYLSNKTYEYAYTFDTNRYLKYTYAMFSKYTKKINNKGIHTVFSKLKNYIISLNKCYEQSTLQLNESNSYDNADISDTQISSSNQKEFFRLQ